MHIQYDPAIIYTEASRLYAEAARIVVRMAVLGGLAGILIGLVGGGLAGTAIREPFIGAMFGAMLVGAVCAYAGYQAGSARAFLLRLEAQRMLVLAQIELNTRPR